MSAGHLSHFLRYSHSILLFNQTSSAVFLVWIFSTFTLPLAVNEIFAFSSPLIFTVALSSLLSTINAASCRSISLIVFSWLLNCSSMDLQAFSSLLFCRRMFSPQHNHTILSQLRCIFPQAMAIRFLSAPSGRRRYTLQSVYSVLPDVLLILPIHLSTSFFLSGDTKGGRSLPPNGIVTYWSRLMISTSMISLVAYHLSEDSLCFCKSLAVYYNFRLIPISRRRLV